MARFEQGRGSGKRVVSLNQIGSLITKDEKEGASERLTGYWQLESPKAAQAALIREALELIANGLKPVDETAIEIAKSVTKKAANAESALPFRQDVYVYNEATGLMLTSRRMAGKKLQEQSSHWLNAIKKGDILPLSLIQDDPFIVRVVVGGELQSAEKEEWVSRVDWHLNLKDGKLCITGGAVLVSDDYGELESYCEQYVREVEVPKGHYQVSVYAYIPGINGSSVIDHLAHGKPEPIGAWFRRTRKSEDFPIWLREWCVGDPSLDPNHESEWEGKKYLPDEEWPDYVHFVVHLQKVDQSPKSDHAALPADGWFGEATNARIPTKCPLGLEGKNVVGHHRPPSGHWTFAQNAFRLAGQRKRSKLIGKSVSVPVEEIVNLFRLAWFSSRWAIPGFRATFPEIVVTKVRVPPGVVSVTEGNHIEFVFSNELYGEQLFDTVTALGAALRCLPDGTLLELTSAPIERLSDADPDVGIHCYYGAITAGMWSITECYPQLDSKTLSGALALAREVAAGKQISLSGPDEAAPILDWAKQNFGATLQGNPVAVRGKLLQLKKRDPWLLGLYGAAAFANRYQSTWPVAVLGAEEEEEDEQWSADAGTPIKGKELLRASSGRSYYATMALLLSESLSERIQEEEKKLKKAKFKHLGDIFCDKFSDVVMRAYVTPAPHVWGIMVVRTPSAVVLELSSRFADGALLVTTRHQGAVDSPQRKIYRQPDTTSTVDQLMEKHLARLSQLEKLHGDAVPAVTTSQGFADYLDLVLTQQYG